MIKSSNDELIRTYFCLLVTNDSVEPSSYFHPNIIYLQMTRYSKLQLHVLNFLCLGYVFSWCGSWTCSISIIGNLLEVKIHRSYSRITESKTPGTRLRILCFHKLSLSFCYMAKFEKHCFRRICDHCF